MDRSCHYNTIVECSLSGITFILALFKRNASSAFYHAGTCTEDVVRGLTVPHRVPRDRTGIPNIY